MDRTYMLSTLDNPFDPFDDFTSWYMFDCEKGHNTSSRLARIANLNDEMTQKEISKELNISRSYVSRIEKRALTKIYLYMKEND